MPGAATVSPGQGPTGAGERIEALDVVRGFALFGILMVNLQYWFRSTPVRYELEPHPWPGLANAIVDVGTGILFDGKFMSLFAMLFGIGLALQMERAEGRGAGFGRFAVRRLGALFLLGVAHIALIWWGDILHVYALVGLLLLAFVRRKTRTIVVWASVLVSLPAVVFTVVAIVAASRPSPPAAPVDQALLRQTIDSTVRMYHEGTWIELARLRFTEYLRELPKMGNTVPFAFMGFLVGLAAWKAGIVKRPSEHRSTLRKVLVIGLLFGISVATLRCLTGDLPRGEMRVLRGVIYGLFPSSTLAHAMAYASGILLLLQREGWRARLAPLGHAGRMALTNYLLQSIICSFVFNGFGLGLYDRVSPAAGVLVVLAIYSLQLALSRWWLGRYRFGPVEWLWRSLTYGRLQPMRPGPGEPLKSAG
jgi:uncharacterized protein